MSSIEEAETEGRSRVSTDRWIAYGLLLLAILLILLAHWPGRLDGDSLATIREVRTGSIGDQRSIVLAWVWRQAYHLVHLGPGVPFALQTIALTGGLYLVLRSVYGRIAAAVLATLLLFAPPTFGFVALVGRDLWFSSCCILAAGLAIGAVRWTGRAHVAAIAGSAFAAVVAIAARQNGAIAILPVLVALAVPALMLLDGRGRIGRLTRSRAALTAVGVGSVATVLVLAATVVAGGIMRDRTEHPQMYTQLYDLGYLTLHENKRFIHSIPYDMQPVQTPSEMVGRWMPTTSIFMRWDPKLNFAPGSNPGWYDARAATRLGEEWRDAIEDHPIDYLRGRAVLWKRQIGIEHTPWYSMVVENQPNPWGYDEPAIPALSDLAVDYATLWAAQRGSLTGGTVHHVWIYLLACIGGLVLLLPRFPLQVRMVGAVAAAGVGLQVGLFFLTPSVQLRYELLAIYAGLVVLCVAARLAFGALLPARRADG